jgi:uncharacterized protein
MGNEVLTQAAAWRLYDDWLRDGGASYVEEPPSMESAFRNLSQSRNAATKNWADSYLAAFAETAGLNFVTFDKAFQGKLTRAIILRP